MASKLWDIASAYKQLAVLPAHSSLAISATWNPETRQQELYRHVALPFGAAAAVLSFNWVSVGLCHVLASLFGLTVTAFYDDFTVTEELSLTGDTTELVDGIFELLGWEMKATTPFSQDPEPHRGPLLPARGRGREDRRRQPPDQDG